MSRIHDFTVPALGGRSEIRLADHRGRVLLLVNTASRCGFTPQYDGLEALHRRYEKEGLSVIGFPCDQFGHQEPGGSDEIAEFCRKNHGVTFPLSEKIDVNGSDAHPLWKFLRSAKGGLLGLLTGGRIPWNFTKFLVDREGRVVGRYAPTTRPEELSSAIEKLL